MQRIAVYFIDAIISLAGTGLHIVYYLLGWRSVSVSGRIAGDAFFMLKKRKREMVYQDIKFMLNSPDDREIGLIAKKSFENYYMRQIETIFFGSLDKKTIYEMVNVEGLENLDGALAKGKGVILLLSHFGSFLLPLPFLGFRGYKVNQVTGKQIHASFLSERIWTWRKTEADRLPVKFIQVDKFLRPIFDALGNNEIIAIAFDGRNSSKWIEVDFFDKIAYFSPGPFELARRTGASIIPTFVVRNEDNRHTIFLEPEFKLSEETDLDKATYMDTQKFANIFEQYINRYPAHFGMIPSKIKMEARCGIGKPLFAENP